MNMTQRIDFYILPSHINASKFACQLAEKAYKQGHRIYVYTESAESTNNLDELMWTHRPESFLPHCLETDSAQATNTPITIGHQDPQPREQEILISLTSIPPAFYQDFERVLIVIPDRASNDMGRSQYRFFQEAGCAIKTHDLRKMHS